MSAGNTVGTQTPATKLLLPMLIVHGYTLHGELSWARRDCPTNVARLLEPYTRSLPPFLMVSLMLQSSLWDQTEAELQLTPYFAWLQSLRHSSFLTVFTGQHHLRNQWIENPCLKALSISASPKPGNSRVQHKYKIRRKGSCS